MTQITYTTGDATICPYCQQPAVAATGADIYPHRPDLATLNFWRCVNCDAYVGCHPGTNKALGRLANAELRQAKSAAHAAFDPLWKTGGMKRTQAYAWLAQRLGIDEKDCHIGMFDVATCKKVAEVCRLARLITSPAMPR